MIIEDFEKYIKKYNKYLYIKFTNKYTRLSSIYLKNGIKNDDYVTIDLPANKSFTFSDGGIVTAGDKPTSIKFATYSDLKVCVIPCDWIGSEPYIRYLPDGYTRKERSIPEVLNILHKSIHPCI